MFSVWKPRHPGTEMLVIDLKFDISSELCQSHHQSSINAGNNSLFSAVCKSTIFRLVVSIVDFKVLPHPTLDIYHIEPWMNLKNIINLSAVFSIYAINELKDGLGGWKIVSVSVNNHAVCFAHKLERITQMQFALPSNGSC